MYFRSFFDEKLAQYSYLIGCQRTGEAIVIDPPRHYEEILHVASKEGLTITAATETHIHADFVSGSRQIAHDLNAKLYLSDEGDENWKYAFANDYHVELVKDGQKFSVGNIDFEVMHTPGHTPESISFLLTDRGGGATDPMGIFTGDFVFVGDIGRPDLLEKAAGVKNSAESGARQMFQSVQRFKQLPDHLMVWPAHGAGSACGKSLGAVPSSTVGYEKMFNWAMKMNDEETFVAELLKDQPEAPVYFAEMKKVNKLGPAILKNQDIPVITTIAEWNHTLQNESIFLLDTRPATVAEKSLIKGSINIPYNKSFTNWAGWLIQYDEKIIAIAELHEREELLKSLQSIHLDHIIAFVDPKLVSELETSFYETISVAQFNEEMTNSYVMDVRNNVEWNAGHIDVAHHHFLGTLRNTDLDTTKPILLHCQSGARSAIAASVLLSLGFTNIKHLAGGYAAFQKENGK